MKSVPNSGLKLPSIFALITFVSIGYMVTLSEVTISKDFLSGENILLESDDPAGLKPTIVFDFPKEIIAPQCFKMLVPRSAMTFEFAVLIRNGTFLAAIFPSTSMFITTHSCS